MKKVICLVACLSIAVFAQNGQPQQYPPQGQYQQYQQYPPPPQQYPPQGQYQQYQQYPPPPQQYPPQGQYQQYQQYPPPPQQYPPQGQYQQYPPQQQYQPPQAQPMPPPQENARKTQFGIKALFVMNDFTTGNSDVDKNLEIGFGYGGGMVQSFPITNTISFVSETNFLYRTIANATYEEDECYYGCYEVKEERSIYEFALSFPLTFQVTPVADMPIYLAAGVQLDIPFSTKVEWEVSVDGEKIDELSGSKKLSRASLDFGIALGAGFRIGQMSIDLRTIIGLTTLSDEQEDKDTSLNQYGAGVSFFF